MDDLTKQSLIIGLVGFFMLVILNGVVAAAHSALINSRKQTLRERADNGNRRARSALRMAEHASVLLASRELISVTLHFLALGILTIFFIQPLIGLALATGGNPQLVPIVIYMLLWLLAAFVMLTLGELFPDIMASSKPENTAVAFDPLMRPLFTLTGPISRLTTAISTTTAKLLGRTRDMSYVTEEEIKTLVDAGSEEGVIQDDAKEMIYSIFQFGDKVVSEVMTPRPDVHALEGKTSVAAAMDFVLANGNSRIPIYEETIDHVIGVLYAKDIFRTLRSGSIKAQQAPVREYVRPAYFIPASKKAGALMDELQVRKLHMAIVIDEYGGMAGLITFEDLLEEIVGEIQDEYDPQEEADSEQISDHEYLFDGGIALADVNDMLDVELPTDESDTLGGYVFSVLGKIPLAGDTFNAEGLEFRVEVIVGRRIRKMYIRKLPTVAEEEAEAERERENPTPVAVIEPESLPDTLAERLSALDSDTNPDVPTINERPTTPKLFIMPDAIPAEAASMPGMPTSSGTTTTTTNTDSSGSTLSNANSADDVFTVSADARINTFIPAEELPPEMDQAADQVVEDNTVNAGGGNRIATEATADTTPETSS